MHALFEDASVVDDCTTVDDAASLELATGVNDSMRQDHIPLRHAQSRTDIGCLMNASRNFATVFTQPFQPRYPTFVVSESRIIAFSSAWTEKTAHLPITSSAKLLSSRKRIFSYAPVWAATSAMVRPYPPAPRITIHFTPHWQKYGARYYYFFTLYWSFSNTSKIRSATASQEYFRIISA